jgi:hypothetical protein
MPKMLITGNGFDLFHFFPATYGNFICTLDGIESINSSSIEYISFKELFGERLQTWIAFKSEIKKVLHHRFLTYLIK